jgi:DNA polymerase
MDAYRAALLTEMGIDRWVLKTSTDEPIDDSVASSAVESSKASLNSTTSSEASDHVPLRSSREQADSLVVSGRSSKSDHATQTASVTHASSVRSLNNPPAPSSLSSSNGKPVGISACALRSNMTWDELGKEAADCTRCALNKSRQHVVFGSGPTNATVLIIGESPSIDDDAQTIPFSGQAGDLLNRMLAAIGLARNQVYLTHLLKCLPVGNREPKTEEVEQCGGFLFRQIELIKPSLIICLGRIAAHHVLGVESPITQLRGQSLVFPPLQIPVVVTYHPSYLLKAPAEKAKAWLDLKKIKKMLDGGDSSSGNG